MIAQVAKATPEEARALSIAFNRQLATHFSPNECSFYRLFKVMDVDGSGLVDFEEFERMVRKQLRLGKGVIPQERLLGLWRTLDTDQSGLVCQGEFGRFMRFGCGSLEPCPPIDEALSREQEASHANDAQRSACNPHVASATHGKPHGPPHAMAGMTLSPVPPSPRPADDTMLSPRRGRVSEIGISREIGISLGSNPMALAQEKLRERQAGERRARDREYRRDAVRDAKKATRRLLAEAEKLEALLLEKGLAPA